MAKGTKSTAAAPAAKKVEKVEKVAPKNAKVEKKGAKKATSSKVVKAVKAQKTVQKGAHQTRHRRVHLDVHFHRPQTLRLARNPKYPRVSKPRLNKLDAFRIIKRPVTTEGVLSKIEDENTLVFIVDAKATKQTIKRAVQDLYKVKAVKVNTLVRPDGQKKAFVRLDASHEAAAVASTIGIM